MGQDRRTKGRVKREDRTAIEILKDLGIKHEYTEEELMDGEFEELLWVNKVIIQNTAQPKYVILSKSIYKILEFVDFGDHAYSFEGLEPNNDGSFSFDYTYYNGYNGRCWEEILSNEIETFQDKVAGEIIDEVLAEEKNNSKSS